MCLTDATVNVPMNNVSVSPAYWSPSFGYKIGTINAFKECNE